MVCSLAITSAIISLFYFSARSSEHIIRISTNSWVGFTPFAYAQEKGWLEQTPFRFLWQVDLSENARLYERGFTHGFTATQYEKFYFNDYSKVKPAFLIDRSAGADVILSNYTLADLKKTTGSISVYLELGTVSEDLFKAFVTELQLDDQQFHIVNISQKKLSTLKIDQPPAVIVSYHPYFSALIDRGFMEVGSTATLKSFHVIDAIYVNEDVIVNNKQAFETLKKIFTRAHSAMQENPHEFYRVVEPYLEGQSYEDFLLSLDQIEWLHRDVPLGVLEQLHAQKIATDGLL